MKKVFISILFICLTLASSAAKKDKESKKKDKEAAKTGWNIGPFPAVGYTTDLGFQYGVLADIFQYGDGKLYPDYVYKFSVEASHYTKGNTTLHLQFDGKNLTPGLRYTLAATYLGNQTESFYGFNGASSVYIKALDKISADGMGFYLQKRNQMKVVASLQGQIASSRWSWYAGLTFNNFNAGYAKNKSIVEGTPTLVDLYLKNGIIRENEFYGGNHLDLKGGFIYESRDHENNPTKGINAEILAIGSYDFFQNRNHYLSLSARFIHFVPLVSDKLIFGYRLAYQGDVLGNKPYYMLPGIESTTIRQKKNDGLGSVNTVRGTVANRMLGKGYAWTNIELRYNFLKFDWIRQHWIVSTNPFFDAGMVVQPYKLEEMKAAAAKPENQTTMVPGTGMTVSQLLYSGKGETLHASAGIGFHLIMNHNFNIRVEVAKTFNKNDGNIGVGIGVNYIF